MNSYNDRPSTSSRDGIVKLSRIGITDPQHARSQQDSSPSSWGSASRVFVNLTAFGHLLRAAGRSSPDGGGKASLDVDDKWGLLHPIFWRCSARRYRLRWLGGSSIWTSHSCIQLLYLRGNAEDGTCSRLFTVIGRGRAGSAVQRGLSKRGLRLVDSGGDLVVLCVPDDVIGEVATRVPSGTMGGTRQRRDRLSRPLRRT